VFSSRSVDPSFIKHLERSAGVEPLEVIPYTNPGSSALAALYNRGLADAASEIVVFVHDDVRFDRAGWGQALLDDFRNSDFGVLGVAGTTDLELQSDGTPASWWQDPRRKVGRLTHEVGGRRILSAFSNVYEEPIPVVCVDGVLLAVHRGRIRRAFDERFEGFHFYDIPFCLANHLDGVRIGVTFSVQLTHRSGGRVNAAWHAARRRFGALYGEHLPCRVRPQRLAFDAARIKMKRPHPALGSALVSIVILTQEQPTLVLDCVRSILEHTHQAHYEVLIAVQGSARSEVQSALARLPSPANLSGLRVIDYAELGLTEPGLTPIRNALAERHVDRRARFLLFCDEGLVLQNDAVDRCLNVHLAREHVGTVGIRIHDTDNAVLHQGIELVFGAGSLVAPVHRHARSYYQYDTGVVSVHANSRTFLMIERRWFLSSRFNPEYQGWFDDVELSLRMLLAGRVNLQVGHAVACRHGGDSHPWQGPFRDGGRSDYERLLDFFQQHCIRLFSAELFTAAERASTSGQYQTALLIGQLLLQKLPGHADVYHLLGIVHGRAGHLNEALRALDTALALRPGNLGFRYSRAEVLVLQRRWGEAESEYRAVLASRPKATDAGYRLAQVLSQQGQIEAAVAAYRAVIRRQPKHQAAYLEAARLLHETAQTQAALRLVKKGVAAMPGWTEGRYRLGLLLMADKRYRDAARAFRAAAEQEPESIRHRHAWGVALETDGDLVGAREAYRPVVDDPSTHPLQRLGLDPICPQVASDESQLEHYRRRLAAGLAALENSPMPSLNLGTPSQDLAIPPMAMIYHGRDDLGIKRAWADLARKALPKPPFQPLVRRQEGAVRLGFLVTLGHEGVFSKTLSGLIDRLRIPNAELVIFCGSRVAADFLRTGFKREDVRFVILPLQLDAALARIRAEALSLLYYWEIGTEGANYFLPFYRLAPVQCTGWGRPWSSGIPSVDYYLSSAALETPESDTFFSEQLIRLPRLPVWLTREPAPDAALNRSALGLPDTGPLYVCPQNPLKLHPDFDDLLARILSRDRKGTVVLIERFQKGLIDAIKARQREHLGALCARVAWLPRLDYDAYRRLLAAADVVLDTPHYGAGVTAYDSFSVGAPIVTLPGRFSRGRVVYALYRQMGIDGAVANDAEGYAELATSIATNATKRALISTEILAHSEAIFEDSLAVIAFQDFIESAIQQTRCSGPGLGAAQGFFDEETGHQARQRLV
jgi:predicted O-linked N-acetylglucosamine transferase (SPINDLY family)/GT2 family glycosyltransferase